MDDQECMDSLNCAQFCFCLCIHQNLSFILLIGEPINLDKIAVIIPTKTLIMIQSSYSHQKLDSALQYLQLIF